MINNFENEMKEIFSEKIKLFSKSCEFSKGYFKLVFFYFPLNYKIIVENEIRTFTISIEDNEKASNSLYRIEKFDNTLSEKNIIYSAGVLKRVLDRNDMNLYFYVDKKLYRKNSKGVQRVKDLKELLNG